MKHLEKTISLLSTSYSPFHAVDNIVNELLDAGFVELDEKVTWDIAPGKSYFVRRNDSSVIAFRIPKNPVPAFKVIATHSDSPTYKLKPNPILVRENILRLDVEPYGGMIASTWLDRPLSIAGRVMIKEGNDIKSRFLAIEEDLLTIPNVAIHMKRGFNADAGLNPAVDLVPILGTLPEEGFDFNEFLKKELGTDGEILGHDLFLFAREEPHLLGLRHELLSAPRLDDLSSAYATLQGFLEAKGTHAIDVFVCFDNEEVGSLSRQGANSNFFKHALFRIAQTVYGDKEAKRLATTNGILISADNSHANHPNHPELSDPTTKVLLNGGIALKYNASQKYTTDGFSGAIVKAIAESCGVNVQEYTNRSDLPGGSTLGNISNSEVSFVSADIGIPQLAMHSAVETCGVYDIEAMVEFTKAFFSTEISMSGNAIHLE